MTDVGFLWRSANAPWGRVRAVVTAGEYVLVLDDLNSDLREVAMQLYRCVDDDWTQLADLDDAGFPDIGETHGGGVTLGDDGRHYGWSYGRVQAGAVVELVLGDEPLTVTADDDGWWLCVVESPESGQPPREPR